MTGPAPIPANNRMTVYPGQVRAAAPDASVWVAASAGSGKTKVLADRVIRLMLAGTPPGRILCLTFTRAAAAEMSIRINGILGRWAASVDEALVGEIDALCGAPPDAGTLGRARRLIAEVLDVPGGMKIQTIHSFCESLLGRFPLEADIAPHFEVMDERTASELMHAARDEVLDRAAADPEGPLAAAMDEITGHVSEVAFSALMGEVSRERGRLQRLIARHGDPETYRRAVCRVVGVGEDEADGDALAAGCAEDAFDGSGLHRAREALAGGSKTDVGRARAIAAWLAADPATRATELGAYKAAFLTKDGEPLKRLATKAVVTAMPDALDILTAEAVRLADLEERRNALAIARATGALMRLAADILDAYGVHKERAAKLDYDDLILRVRSLLESSEAASWVLYKLDGGIDHILIDEAQDTNPDQWAIVRAIADEFFSGEGTAEGGTERPRTVFAVGDAKQSIFSFQRADPEEFARMNAYFARRAEESDHNWDQIGLDVSFRSAPAVLTAVDAVFAGDAARDGLGDATVRHSAHRSGQAGRVELWPTVAPDAPEPRSAWDPPRVQIDSGDAPPTRLAHVIAGKIKQWIDDEEMLESRGRPVRAGDILVLVQRRTGFVDDLVRALKTRDIGVAGVDRLVLSNHLAVMDMVALGQFLLLAEDDLTLATVLKGPFIGFDEPLLFDLAYDRGGRPLWRELGRRAGENERFAQAHEFLSGLLGRVDYDTPFALYADLLGRGGGRERIVARMGIDAIDPLDEFLSLALAYQRSHPPSLQGFLQWFLEGKTEIKRDLEQAVRDEVRIMTVHGAKGLQAPVVFLADTVRTPGQASGSHPTLLWREEAPVDGVIGLGVGGGEAPLMLWRPRAALREPETTSLVNGARAKREREYRRLLYVAMTRAEDRLTICGYETSRNPAEDCWYRLATDGLAGVAGEEDMDLTPLAEPGTGWDGTGLVLTNPQGGDPDKPDSAAPRGAGPMLLPGWAKAAAPDEPDPPTPLAPSRPSGDEPPVFTPLGDDSGRRFARGLLIHDLLQYLPDIDPASQREAALNFLTRPVHGLTPEEAVAIADDTLAVIGQPDFAEIFGPASRAEVALTGVVGGSVISGRVDRLVVTDSVVRVVDYKTNRPPPRRAEDVPAIYLRQLAAYRAVLARIYPSHEIICALLWTDSLDLMNVPDLYLDPYLP